MIDVQTETLIPLSEAAALALFCRRGRKPHHSTVWRWALRGAIGSNGERHKLETIRMPGGLHTTHEACLRFLAALNGKPVTTKPTQARDRARRQATSILDAAGV